MYPGKALLEGGNSNMVVYQKRGLKQQQFVFDQTNHIWQARQSHNVFAVAKTGKGELQDGLNVVTAKYEAKNE